ALSSNQTSLFKSPVVARTTQRPYEPMPNLSMPGGNDPLTITVTYPKNSVQPACPWFC
ncbi:hypothetical protein KL941_005425, partial [Ogataea angusta]